MLEADNLYNILQGIILVRKNAVGIPKVGFQVQISNIAVAANLNF